uniref:Uncharacterized protein n=1 Tax=Anguilla anguilla TaxID=7936 RepID=A0A0E9UH77_ANGAN
MHHRSLEQWFSTFLSPKAPVPMEIFQDPSSLTGDVMTSLPVIITTPSVYTPMQLVKLIPINSIKIWHFCNPQIFTKQKSYFPFPIHSKQMCLQKVKRSSFIY